MKKKVLSALTGIVLFVLIAACGQTPEAETKAKTAHSSAETPAGKIAEPVYGDTIVVGSIGDASNLIPLLASDSPSHQIAGYIYNGLVRYDKNLKLEGELAESWEISADGLTITFHLRRDVHWHDGSPFTADDVLFTYRTIIDPKTPTAYAGDFEQVKEARVLDPYTFQVTYAVPFAPALSSWGLAILPKHLLEGQDITKSPLSRQPVGTGPFCFSQWLGGEKIELVANHDYFEGRPYIDRYRYRIIPDTATMFLELKAGNLDWMGLTPIQYDRQTDGKKFAEQFNKYRYLSFSYTYLGYNLLNPLFQDKRVRQALSYAINKQEIIDGVLLGYGQVATGPYKPDTWFYHVPEKTYLYDPEKAKKLLQDAGWTDRDNDGLLDKDGRPFSFTLMTNQGNALRAQAAVIIQRRLQEIGIEMKIRIIEWSAFINEFIDKKKFEAVILGWTTGQDPDIYDIWHSSKTDAKELNFISFTNPEVDLLLEKGRHTFDQQERQQYYARFQEILAEEQPYTFLYVPESLPIIASRFHGVEPAPAGISHNFIKWHVPQALQKYTQ
ncbi:MAG: peptide-binding protein [Deltaproteobacteria bacterium]|nr:peptide-binding protein [Candidatus Anaeroferrophillus wilburensis]MBN2889711.1 peptide-binding protein [Deltaproteobacteria bacterium]